MQPPSFIHRALNVSKNRLTKAGLSEKLHQTETEELVPDTYK